MKSQQQPMQYTAWRRPIRRAPRRPERQWWRTNPIGDWQWARHTSLVRVTCHAPAATRTPAEARRTHAFTIPIGLARPRAASPANAARAKSPQRRKYADANRAVAAWSGGRTGRPASSRVIER